MLKLEDITPEMIKRFWSYVKIGENGECSEWISTKTKFGYGRIRVKINGKWVNISAHRFAYTIYHQQNIPEGMCICHHCDQPACTSKNCLFLGSYKDNHQDMVNKGRRVNPMEGKHFSEQSKLKMSASRKGKCKGNKFALGYKQSIEQRLKISEFHKNNTYFLGHKHTEESKINMKISAKKRWDNIDPEIKNKIIESQKGRICSEETRKKISASNMGRKHTPESIEKCRAAAKAYHARKKLEKLIPS